MEKLKLGWIGLGNMGNPMVKNLLKAGFEVSIYNRSRDKEKELVEAGAVSAPDPAAVVAAADIIISMLSNDDAVKTVYEGTSGLLATPASGKLLIDMSTVSPETSRYLAEAASKQGYGFLEAPVSGSVKPAQDGTLIILAAGAKADYEKAKPVFDALGKLALHLGDAGTGSSAKLAINYLVALNLQGLAETVLFAEKLGVSKTDMLTIINEGACSNALIKMKTPAVINENYPAAFALKHMVKDLRLATASGLDSPLAGPLLKTFTKANEAGLGDEDAMAVIKALKS